MAKQKSTAKKRKSGNGKATASKIVAKKLPSFKEPLSKSKLVEMLADHSELSKKQVKTVIENLTMVIEGHVKSRGPGVFVMPQLFKIVVVKKPARPARKGVNPFTGEEMTFKAKPAYRTVKVKALKKLKEMVD
jgi:nucleoid DNA-binding protein